MRQWRLLYDNPAPGVRNMAVDETILESVAAGDSLPTLRLYAWSPPCLSLGYAQRASDADLKRINTQGWDVVRRPTGGKAILHTDELTYSLSLPVDHPIAAGDIIESYRRISRALLVGLQPFGVQPQSERMGKTVNKNVGPVCFETPSHYEITVVGRKLIGSAQLRRKNGMLQHGSLPLTGDVTRICDALNYPDAGSREQARQQVRERAATLEDVIGVPVAWEEAAAALVEAFAGVFAVDFEISTLSEQEEARVEALIPFYQSLEYARRV
jgi:lipoyl(octanoyl) transferase